MEKRFRPFRPDELAALAVLSQQDTLLALRLLGDHQHGGADAAAVRAMLTAESDRAARLADLALTGKIVVLVWLLDMIAMVKQTHAAAALAANPAVPSGPGSPLGKRVLAEVEYLAGFADDIAAHKKKSLIPDPRARARQYPKAAWGTYWATRRARERANGMKEERNVLGATEHHCPECPALTSRGWVPLGELPLPGDRICRRSCFCELVFR